MLVYFLLLPEVVDSIAAQCGVPRSPWLMSEDWIMLLVFQVNMQKQLGLFTCSRHMY